jgi:hypothetical protein
VVGRVETDAAGDQTGTAGDTDGEVAKRSRGDDGKSDQELEREPFEEVVKGQRKVGKVNVLPQAALLSSAGHLNPFKILAVNDQSPPRRRPGTKHRRKQHDGLPGPPARSTTRNAPSSVPLLDSTIKGSGAHSAPLVTKPKKKTKVKGVAINSFYHAPPYDASDISSSQLLFYPDSPNPSDTSGSPSASPAAPSSGTASSPFYASSADEAPPLSHAAKRKVAHAASKKAAEKEQEKECPSAHVTEKQKKRSLAKGKNKRLSAKGNDNMDNNRP